jgi:1,4-alpha-glucan branching enzyme
MKSTSQHETTFSYKAPSALSVMLIGDFTHWQRHPISLQKQPDGIWQTSLPLPAGEHRYTFLIDGKWRDDDEFKLQVTEPRSMPVFAMCGEA